ncbi:hypothetical protein BASA50_006844 [Batrachochytrium salamandrivorans]|uniref:PIN domain-containing protein n=1 Tax=Batrachochytrium salamandrivorans TaxID=1357716 RepID=A0ABQ8F8N7_9FUNG|nr:hypothetical protein BASA60_006460 [Batrachochytrium salamandrivorans]KAH6594147.1 hypothetical protein BASA50_006844 [Batrachochytrium salamandrivorans]
MSWSDSNCNNQQSLLLLQQQSLLLLQQQQHPSTAVVVDTNFLIAQLALLRKVVDLMPAHMFLFIPDVVIKELDGLKQNHSKETLQTGDALDRIKVSLGDCARQAIQFLYTALSTSNSSSSSSNNSNNTSRIRGQSKAEADRLPYRADANNDDLILESCLQCVSDIASTAVLLSNDKNLCIKAAINGIPTISEFRGNHHALLDEIQAQVSKHIAASKVVKPIPASYSSLTHASIQTPFHIASNVSHLPFQSAQDPHPIANSSTLHHEQYDSDVYMMDMDEMPSNTGHDIPAPVFLEAFPTPVNISPASMHQEQQDLHALLQLESGLFGCVLACIPVILQKAHGNDWIAIARVSQPTELAHIIEMIDQLWHSVFVDVLGKNIHAQLSLNRRIAQDIRRSVRRQKMALTRGDLLIFLRDMESIACECCRYCGFMDDAVRVRGIIQHVRSVLVEVNYS